MVKENGRLFVSSVLAGMCIAMGGTVFLRLKDAFPGGNVVGALLFTVGLFVVCTRGYALFTGKACYIFHNPPAYLGKLLLIWLGKLAGTGFFALMERLTAICGTKGIDAVAAGLVAAKIANTGVSLVILGAVCNIFIFIAVNGYAKNPHELGKYLALFLGVSCFILCGSEHSVADMYYWWVSGCMLAEPGTAFICLLYISLGNIMGGVLFPVLERYI